MNGSTKCNYNELCYKRSYYRYEQPGVVGGNAIVGTLTGGIIGLD